MYTPMKLSPWNQNKEHITPVISSYLFVIFSPAPQNHGSFCHHDRTFSKFHMNEIISWVLFLVWFLLFSIIIFRFICIVLFYYWVVFHFMNMPQFVYPFSYCGHLRSFHFLAVAKKLLCMLFKRLCMDMGFRFL